MIKVRLFGDLGCLAHFNFFISKKNPWWVTSRHIVVIQIAYLQHWPELEGENGSTLIGAIEALQACTLRLPVTSGAQVRDQAIIA